MQNDTISRSALVAELEAFKMSLGDIVLRFVVDRVIEIVKAHKAPEAAPSPAPEPVIQAPAPEPVSRTCYTCRYVDNPLSKHPCRTCCLYENWEALP